MLVIPTACDFDRCDGLHTRHINYRVCRRPGLWIR